MPGLPPIKFISKRRHNPAIPTVEEFKDVYRFNNINYQGRAINIEFDKEFLMCGIKRSAEEWYFFLKKSGKVLAPIDLIFSAISEFYDLRDYKNEAFDSFKNNFLRNLNSGELITSTRIKETRVKYSLEYSTSIAHFYGADDTKCVEGAGISKNDFEHLTGDMIEGIFVENELAGAIFGTESIERIVRVLHWFSGQQIGRRFGRFNESSRSYTLNLTGSQKEMNGILLLGKDERHFYIKNSGVNETVGCAYRVVIKDE